MLRLKTRAKGNKYVDIDAQHGGGKLRILNHSCNPCARFHEVQTESELTVVAVTTRDIFPGEEVTVSYGDKLWFICRCGCLVAKNKPSGINGEIPESQKPIALTQEIHVHIEAKASVFENFDGNDGGEDDDALVKHVKSLSNSVDTGNVKPDAQNSLRRSSTQTPQPRASFLPANHDLSVRVEENQEVRSSTDEQLATTHSPGTDPHRLIDNVGIGSISTSEGTVPVAFAQDIENWPSDNGEEATLREEDREVEKRPVQETPGTTAYVTAKRFNARQRMQEMEKRVTMNEDTQNAAGLEVANLTAYFREDANRRADAEEKRRREDLNERRETERKEREEREQTRREEENRRVQELAERRRQFDERMKLDRQEAGERHQQMMILLSAFMPKKQGSQKEDENSTHL
ncbi:hypothetical protein AM588_10003136 [Phytophthora nicotianae]|uniref:SET domain-containing protein n=1 Tax=Phytophthora nicotianae TaxID=4792 RepID=A0A0W8D542_PHYNI|nr:hypothetical protein AM588_10003136 [Phytophthora nicotianae]